MNPDSKKYDRMMDITAPPSMDNSKNPVKARMPERNMPKETVGKDDMPPGKMRRMWKGNKNGCM